MKKATQFLSYEQIPYKKGRVVRVWSRKGKPFLIEFLSDIWKLLKWFKDLPGKKDVFIGIIFLIGFIPRFDKVKAAPLPKPIPKPAYIQPITRLQPAIAISVPVPQEAQPVPEPEPVAPPPPAPVVASGGCTTGVTAPDYYENLLMQRESGGNSCITNSIGCVGLLQACPGSKLYAVCPTLEVSCQFNFFEGYMRASYGTWANAWAQDETRSPHWW